MDPAQALVAFLIAFGSALVVLGAFGACIRSCAHIFRQAPDTYLARAAAARSHRVR